MKNEPSVLCQRCRGSPPTVKAAESAPRRPSSMMDEGAGQRAAQPPAGDHGDPGSAWHRPRAAAPCLVPSPGTTARTRHLCSPLSSQGSEMTKRPLPAENFPRPGAQPAALKPRMASGEHRAWGPPARLPPGSPAAPMGARCWWARLVLSHVPRRGRQHPGGPSWSTCWSSLPTQRGSTPRCRTPRVSNMSGRYVLNPRKQSSLCLV